MYILYIALVINLGPFPGSFVGHSEKFMTFQECNEKAIAIHDKVVKKLGNLVLKYEDKCIKVNRGKVSL